MFRAWGLGFFVLRCRLLYVLGWFGLPGLGVL